MLVPKKIRKPPDFQRDLGVSKNIGTPKMDGENNEKPYSLMDDLGGFTIPIFGSTPI